MAAFIERVKNNINAVFEYCGGHDWELFISSGLTAGLSQSFEAGHHGFIVGVNS